MASQLQLQIKNKELMKKSLDKMLKDSQGDLQESDHCVMMTLNLVQVQKMKIHLLQSQDKGQSVLKKLLKKYLDPQLQVELLLHQTLEKSDL